jgi:hypothetical protein
MAAPENAWRYKMLRQALRLAGGVTPDWALPKLQADGLIEAAGVAPSPAAEQGLRQLLAALHKDTELSLFGRVSVHWDMIRLLRNAALVEQAHNANPALGAAPVTAPVFILGLPRSGTTFLHGLLAEDDANLVPRNWQTIYPKPRPPGFNAATDKAARMVNRQLRLFAGLAPGFSGLHPIHADSPQECSEITAHVFQSWRFDTIFHVPDYFTWMEQRGDQAGFEFHRNFLQFLQKGLTGTWVLKCPDHTFSLDRILQIYPDARFVIVHRDPVDVFASVAHLTEVLRRPFMQNVDSVQIGAQVSERWLEGTRRLVAFDQRTDIPPSRKIHILHDDLIRNPMQTAASIYQQFNMTLSPQAESAMQKSLAARPHGGYARHAPYSLKRFNVSTERLQARFAFYTSTYCAGTR